MGPRRRSQFARVAVAVLAAASIWCFAGCGGGADDPTSSADNAATSAVTSSSNGTDPASGLPWISLAELPPEALDTLDEIAAGPPFPYDRDGITFENREGLLPQHEDGYYQEFTVVTPGSTDRGARRIVVGQGDELYYTDDHYVSFSRIAR